MEGRGREASPGAQNPFLFRIKTEQIKSPLLDETLSWKKQSQQNFILNNLLGCTLLFNNLSLSSLLQHYINYVGHLLIQDKPLT